MIELVDGDLTDITHTTHCVAGGIEDSSILTFLAECGCDIVQRYGVSPPLEMQEKWRCGSRADANNRVLLSVRIVGNVAIWVWFHPQAVVIHSLAEVADEAAARSALGVAGATSPIDLRALLTRS